MISALARGLLAGTLVLLGVAPCAAEPPAASSLLGSWVLVSAEVRQADGRPSPSPFQAGTRGLLVYDATGHVSFQIRRPEHAPFASDDRLRGTDAEVRAAFEGYLAYWGTFELDEPNRNVIHRITACTFPNWEGTTQVRSFELAGDQLTLRSSSGTAGGAAIVATFVWERIR
ncbi:MAG TPA: lipocalin-like domain-containing protein [Thermoanaerobaculia bacterium]|nr:lipocalin-like domain-containing protein [Thermoanaerobaculia bacterium]